VPQCAISSTAHLITPENAAFMFIDYRPSQLATIRSMDPALLLKNVVSTVLRRLCGLLQSGAEAGIRQLVGS
jgi:hypothetical protein